MSMRTKSRLALAATFGLGLVAAGSSQVSAQVLYDPFNYTGQQLDRDLTATAAQKNFSTSGTLWSTRGPQNGLFTAAAGAALTAPTDPAVPRLPAAMGLGAQFPT